MALLKNPYIRVKQGNFVKNKLNIFSGGKLLTAAVKTLIEFFRYSLTVLVVIK
jgi:hypothetical protein